MQKLQQDYLYEMKMKDRALKIIQEKDKEIIRLKQMLETKLDKKTF